MRLAAGGARSMSRQDGQCRKEMICMNDFQMPPDAGRPLVSGSLEVVCGPMFSGKSEELIRRMKRVQISGKKFVIFKPSIDTRYDATHVVSHDQRKLEAVITGISADAIGEIRRIIIEKNPEVVAFDEIWMYDDGIVDFVLECVRQGRRVVAAGLDTDFRGEPFPNMARLLAHADFVDKLKAICIKCKDREAVMTQRLIDGMPAKYGDPTIVVGAAEMYEARCRDCHEIKD